MADPFYWTTADALAHAVQLPAGTQFAQLNAISRNGTVIVGCIYDAGGNQIPAIWTNGAYAALPMPGGTRGATATLICDDASIIAGSTIDNALLMWTDGGASVTTLPLMAGAAAIGNTVDAIDHTYGDIIAGTSIDAATFRRKAVWWENGLGPTVLPNARANSSAFVMAMSGDASDIFGYTFSNDGNQDRLPLYWSSLGAYTEHHLTTGAYSGGVPVDCSDGRSVATFVPSNGVAGPPITANERYYWDNTTTASGGFYGTLHQYGLLDGFSTNDVAFKGSQGANGPFAVGSAYNTDGVDNVAVRWAYEVPQVLRIRGAVSVPARAMCVAQNTYPIGGTATSLDGLHTRAGFWDFFEDWTTLQVPDGYSDTTVSGISLDGAVVFGFATPAPPSSATVSVADLWFGATPGFVDLSASANRRLFVGLDGSAQFLGDDGSRPFGVAPPVFLTRPSSGSAADTFADNAGLGAAFAIAGGDLATASPGPACATYRVASDVPPNTPSGADPQIMLSVSDDGGWTFSPLQKWRSLGEVGDYRHRLRWLKMGQFRQRQIRLEITDPVRRELVGFYVDLTEGLD